MDSRWLNKLQELAVRDDEHKTDGFVELVYARGREGPLTPGEADALVDTYRDGFPDGSQECVSALLHDSPEVAAAAVLRGLPAIEARSLNMADALLFEFVYQQPEHVLVALEEALPAELEAFQRLTSSAEFQADAPEVLELRKEVAARLANR